MGTITEAIIAIFILLGAAFALIGSVGLARLPDFYMRLHGPTKATTLGVGGMLIGSLIFFTVTRGSLSVHELLITLFLFITAPVSAHIVSKAALHRRVDCIEKTRGRPWEDHDHTPEGDER